MEPNQAHAPSATALIPGFVRGGDQILFVQPGPDVLLGGQLEIIEFQFNALTGDQQVRFDLRQSPLQLGIEVFDNRFALRPLMDIFR
ncbi:Uncharacterised protein [Klebsiella pneumoniae]|nr:Uncharacterised protein [Klebsiella pneumoniae]